MSDDVTLTTPGLDKLLKALKAKPPVARVGILGDKGQRTTKSDEKNLPTNAEIGAAHEFGTTKLPMRSFLRVPISDNLGKEMEKSGMLDKNALNEVVQSGSLLPWMQKVAIIAEGCVADAFDTGGNGKWKPSDMKYKENQQTLVETQQLRNSITSEVK